MWFIVRDNCVGTGFRDTGVFSYGTGLLFFVMGYKLRHGNKPTELIKCHDFVWCQMWDVTLMI